MLGYCSYPLGQFVEATSAVVALSTVWLDMAELGSCRDCSVVVVVEHMDLALVVVAVPGIFDFGSPKDCFDVAIAVAVIAELATTVHGRSKSAALAGHLGHGKDFAEFASEMSALSAVA